MMSRRELPAQAVEGNACVGEVWLVFRTLHGQEHDSAVCGKSGGIRHLQPGVQVSLSCIAVPESLVAHMHLTPCSFACRCPGCKETGYHQNMQVASITWTVQGAVP